MAEKKPETGKASVSRNRSGKARTAGDRTRSRDTSRARSDSENLRANGKHKPEPKRQRRSGAGTGSAAAEKSRASRIQENAVRGPGDEPALNTALADAQNTAESILGANPVLGLNASEILDAARRLARLFSLNPRLVARREAEMAVELVRVLWGQSRVEPDPKDRRFRHPVWWQSPYYRRVMQAYLVWRNTLHGILDSVEANPRDKERARFILTQITAAAAPTNHVLGNPGFLANAVQSRGFSLVRGVRNFIDDLLHNGGMPSQVDERPFKVGKNLAVSPGAVVFRNAVCEVIQYQPGTAKVQKTPVLVVPPQINKYYIVDLAPGKSFVDYAVRHQVQLFAISWRNPTAAQRDWGLETYVAAARDAIDAVREITGSDSVNLMAACAGGFTAAVLLGHLWDIGESFKVRSLTLLVTVLDTSAETLLGLFASDTSIRLAIERTRRKGILDGQSMARAFAWLRPNDLVWSFFANNYLMGNSPPAFDVLYWNNDTTRLPAQFHADLLRIFQQNPLTRTGGMKVLGSAIDLKKVDCDVFIVSGITDHITPWNACYLSTQMFGGNVRFVLSSSGHIQSIVNPPDNPKAKFYLHDDYSLSAQQWLKRAQLHDGSWWPYWLEWVDAHAGGLRSAPDNLGSGQYPPGDRAPGRYVHQR